LEGVHLSFHHGCTVVPEKSIQNHWVLLTLPPHHLNAWVKPEGDDDMQEHEYSDIIRAKAATIHDDM
jgi:hypothetical protein